MLDEKIQRKIDKLDAKIKADNINGFNDIQMNMAHVVVFEKFESFYEVPARIITTAMPKKYYEEFRKIFPKDKYIVMLEDTVIGSVKEFLS